MKRTRERSAASPGASGPGLFGTGTLRARATAVVWLICGQCSFIGAAYLVVALRTAPPLVPWVLQSVALGFVVAGLYVSFALGRLPLPEQPPAAGEAAAQRAWRDLLGFPSRAARLVLTGGLIACLLAAVPALAWGAPLALVGHGLVAAGICMLLELVLVEPTLRLMLNPAIGAHQRANPGLRLSDDEDPQRLRRSLLQGVLTFPVVGMLIVVVVASQWPYLSALHVVVLGTLAALIGLATWAYTDQLIEPLRVLQTGVREIAADHLDWRAGPVGLGEVALLAESLDLSLDRLRTTRAALAEAERLLAHAQRLETTGLLAAGLFHDVASPTAVALLNLQLALEDCEDPKQAACLRDALAAVESIHNVVRGFRTLHRASQDATFADLDAVLDGVLRMARPQLRRVRLVTRLDAVGVAVASPQQLSQVLVNLVINAAQAVATTENATVQIITEEFEGSILVGVRDNGPGLAPQVLARLFDAVVTSKSDGTGLGLYISRRIITQMGGQLWHERVDNWTVFYVRLPAVELVRRRGPE
jgi:signal transduction histidine kinase